MVLHYTLTTMITCTSDTQICYTDYCYTYMFHWYTDIPIHRLPHVILVLSSLHGYSVHSYFMFLHHCYIDSPVYMHWLDHGFIPVTRIMDYIITHGYSCILVILIIVYVTWIIVTWVVRLVFPLHDYFPFWYWYSRTEYMSCWYAMCGTKCHVDSSHGGHL